MRLRSGYWQDLTTTDFRLVDPEQTVALLPVAAVEQHGPHLPLATDALINEGIVRATLERLPPQPTVLVLPPLNIGSSLEHTNFPGTLSAPAETLSQLWLEVGRSVARTGIRKLVLFNTHGGQKSLLDSVALKLRAELKMLVVRATYFSFGAPPGLFDATELMYDIHGGEVETSLLLHLRPDLVRTTELQNFRGLAHELAVRNKLLGVDKPIGIGWLSEDLNVAGVSGNAARADPQRGAEHLVFLAERLSLLLAEVAATPLSIIR